MVSCDFAVAHFWPNDVTDQAVNPIWAVAITYSGSCECSKNIRGASVWVVTIGAVDSLWFGRHTVGAT